MLKKYLFFFFLSTFLALLILEILFQTIPTSSIKPKFYFTTPAYGIPIALKASYKSETTLGGYFKFKIITNEKRLRESRSISYAKPRDTFRILCLGDSILFGAGVDYQETFSYQLETILNKHFPSRKFEVINAAAPGWSPIEYLIYLKREGYKFSPDLVLASNFIDDIDGLRTNRITYGKLDHSRISDKEILVKLGKLKIKKEKITKQTLLLDYFLNNYELGILSENLFVFNKIRKRVWNIHVKLSEIELSGHDPLKKFLHKIDPSNNKKIVWSIEESGYSNPAPPSLMQLQYDLVIAELKKQILNIGSRILLLKLPTFQQAYKMVHYHHQYSSAGKNPDEFSLIESMTHFQNNKNIPLFFPKDSHWTPAGNLFAALATYNEISKKYLKGTNEKYIDISSPVIIQRLKQANEKLEHLLNKNPSQKFMQAIVHANNNRFKEAIKTLEQFIQKEPNNSEALFYLGSLYLEIKNPKNAAEYFERALQYPKPPLSLPQTLLYAGRAYLQLKEFDKAESFFEKAAQFEDFNPGEAHNHLAQTYFWAKKYSLAEQSWLKAIQKSPNSIKYYILLGTFYLETGEMKQALSQFETAQKISPKNPKSFFLQGLTYLKLNQRGNAHTMFSKVLELEPQNQLALNYLNKLNSYKN